MSQISFTSAVAIGVGLATFNKSVVNRKYKWIISVILIATRIWFFVGQSLSNLSTLVSSMVYYPMITNTFTNMGEWDQVLPILCIHLVYSVIEHGLPDTIQYNVHYIGIIMYKVIYMGCSAALYQSIGVFDLVSVIYISSPFRIRPFAVLLFFGVRVVVFSVLMHFETYGKGIISLVLTCQIWITYLLVMQYGKKQKKKQKKRAK